MDDATDRWKDEYRALVKEQAANEHEWNQVRQLLADMLKAVLTSCLGRSDELDDRIGRLRLDVDAANSIDQMRQVQDAVSQLARQLVSAPPTAVAPIESLADKLNTVRDNFVKRLIDEPLLAEEAKTLASEFSEAREHSSAQGDLDLLAERLIEAFRSLSQQKAETERFLNEVRATLSSLEQWAMQDVERVSAQRSANDSLQQDVAAEVSSLESQVASSASLDDLKQHMRSRIAAIASRIRSFRETEDEKLAAAEQRNAELTTELSTLKSRTEMLSEQLEQQQALLLLDSLTQVHSRFAYERRMREEFASFERTSHPVSYTIWDIDHFKQINDSFGHQAGDNVLRSVAGYLSRYTRADDFVARIGGEEFVILLPGTDQKNALVIAEKLRALIAAAEFPMDGEVHSITISCGVAQLRAGDTLESVYDRADQALYAAKHAGRNCCKAA